MKTLISLLLLIAIFVGGYFFWQKHRQDKALADGSFTCVGCLSPEQEKAYQRFDHGEGPDPEAGRRTLNRQNETDRQNETQADRQSMNQNGGSTGSQTVTPSSDTINQPSADAPYPVQPSSPYGPRPLTITPSRPTSSPTGEIAQPYPANGMRFAGSGVYQWYREGDLTWRLNTQTGASCIVYATMEEWRKPLVLQHGCGNSL